MRSMSRSQSNLDKAVWLSQNQTVQRPRGFRDRFLDRDAWWRRSGARDKVHFLLIDMQGGTTSVVGFFGKFTTYFTVGTGIKMTWTRDGNCVYTLRCLKQKPSSLRSPPIDRPPCGNEFRLPDGSFEPHGQFISLLKICFTIAIEGK